MTLVRPNICPVCSCEVTTYWRTRRDGAQLFVCEYCGSAHVVGLDRDPDQLFDADYHLEARRFGPQQGWPYTFGERSYWQIRVMEAAARALANRGKRRVRIEEFGPGVSPARALLSDEPELFHYVQRDTSPLVNHLDLEAFGPLLPKRELDDCLVAAFHLLDRVSDPGDMLRQMMVDAPSRVIIAVPAFQLGVADEAGDGWAYNSEELERTVYYSVKGFFKLLERAGAPSLVLDTPSVLLAVSGAGLTQTGVTGSIGELAAQLDVSVEDLNAFSIRYGLLSANDPSLSSRDRAYAMGLQGQTQERQGVDLKSWTYERLVDDFAWAARLEASKSGHARTEPDLQTASTVSCYTDRPLFSAGKKALRVLYVAPKWDYGLPEQGWSYEHQNFFPTWYFDSHVSRFAHFDFVDLARRFGVRKMSELLCKTADDFQPDLIFIVFFNEDHDPSYEALTYLGSRHASATTVGWFCDDHYRFDGYTKNIVPFLNAAVTTVPPSDQRYASAGFSDKVIFSAWAANQYFYFPRTGQHDKDIDVSIVGLPHSDRRNLVALMAECGISVATFGGGWSPSSRIGFAEMLDIFNRSKINLNPAKTAHGDPGQVKGRMFEVPACGGFVLTGETVGAEDFFEPGLEMPSYADDYDLIQKIRLFLNNPALRETVASAGHRRVMREHLWKHRYSQLIGKIAPAIMPDTGSAG